VRLPASPAPSTAGADVDVYAEFVPTVTATTMVMVVMMMVATFTFPSPTHDVSFDATLDLSLCTMQEHLSSDGCGCSTKRTYEVLAHVVLLLRDWLVRIGCPVLWRGQRCAAIDTEGCTRRGFIVTAGTTHGTGRNLRSTI